MIAPSPEVIRELEAALVIGGGLGIIAAFMKTTKDTPNNHDRVVIRAGSPEQYRELCAREKTMKTTKDLGRA